MVSCRTPRRKRNSRGWPASSRPAWRLCSPAPARARRQQENARLAARVSQLLLLLCAEVALPLAGQEAQLLAAQEACEGGRWPSFAQGRMDLSCGAEISAPAVAPPALNGPPPARPPPFVYITECVATGDVVPQWNLTRNGTDGCKCCMKRKVFCQGTTGGRGCSCRLKGSAHRECGHTCACISTPDACRNRVLQRGIRRKLCVKPVGDKGWGVFANEYINKDEFVVEYVGELISEAEAQRRVAACPVAGTYHMEIGLGRSGTATRGGGGVIIDAYAVRNIAAFINFSCDPNLEMRPIESPSGDRQLPRVGFFAKEDISPGTELGYRRDQNATSKRSRQGALPCLCNSTKCVGTV